MVPFKARPEPDSHSYQGEDGTPSGTQRALSCLVSHSGQYLSNQPALKRISELLLTVVVLLLVGSCTTQKRKEDIGFIGKVWHNTNAHYNGYFNAEEILAASTLSLADQHRDNYQQVLPVYEYVASDNPQAVADQLDEAIKKVTVVVNLHPQSHWVDDCYLLAGKAQFLKQDYEAAERTFRYLVNEFPPEEKAKRDRKEKEEEAAESADDKPSKREADRSRAKTKREREQEKKAAEKSAKQQAKERQRYNREVRKRRRQAKKNRKSKSRKKKKKDDPTPETPASTPETPETPEAEPAEATEEPFALENDPEPTPTPQAVTPRDTGLIRLSDKYQESIDPMEGGGEAESYFLKHRPVYQEGRLWLSKTLVERDNFDAAQLILNDLLTNKGTFEDIYRDALALQAHLYLKREKPDEAITYFERAAEVAKDRQERARFWYITGQLYQRRGNAQRALEAFEEVIDAKPNYVMAFSAELNIAQNAYFSGGGTAEQALGNLDDMLKEAKNDIYRDQILYAKARIELDRGNTEEGVAFLQESLEAPASDPNQRVETYYTLGTLYYDQGDFIQAKEYLSQALNAMEQTDERYKSTARLRDNLNDIAENLEVIQLQDSLLRISLMPEDEQRAFAAELAEQQRAAEQAAAEPATPAGNSGGRVVPGRGTNPALQTRSSWFAYDDRAVKRGEREFRRRWGDRPLEDDWRRSQKTSADYFDDPQEVEQRDLVNLYSEGEIDNLLKDVPKDEPAREQARLLIQEALFNLGRLYRDRLNDPLRSIEALEELNRRFPGNNYELDSWYYLYLANTDANQPEQARVYYDKIVQNYGGSRYARALQDPNSLEAFRNEERQINQTYDQLYERFKAGDYQTVVTKTREVSQTMVGGVPIKAKYALLGAMAVGKLEGKNAYISALQRVIASYPNTPEQTHAREIMRFLGQGSSTRLPGTEAEAVNSGAFRVSDDELHYILVVFGETGTDLNSAKIRVAEYNKKYHQLSRLRISNVFIGEGNSVPLLVLRRFKNKMEAMEYYDGVERNVADFLDASETPYTLYAVSQSNYRTIIKARSVSGYDTFFNEQYRD